MTTTITLFTEQEFDSRTLMILSDAILTDRATRGCRFQVVAPTEESPEGEILISNDWSGQVDPSRVRAIVEYVLA